MKKGITCLVFLFSVSILSPQNENLIKNPGFESVQNKLPEDWEFVSWIRDEATTYVNTENMNPETGSRFVSLINKIENHSYLMQKVNIAPLTKYKLSCWIKTKGIPRDNIGASIGILGGMQTSEIINSMNDTWEKVILYILTGEDVRETQVVIQLGYFGGASTGKASFDDVELIIVETIPEDAFTIELGEKTVIDEKKAENNKEKPNKFFHPPPLFFFYLAAVFFIIVIIQFFYYLNLTRIDKQKDLKNGENSAA